MTNEITWFEKIVGAFETLIDQKHSELKENVTSITERQEKWKEQFEDLQTKKMLEIHSALKLLNKNISKTTTDNKDRYDLINKEI